jgi:hypothetical protein
LFPWRLGPAVGRVSPAAGCRAAFHTAGRRWVLRAIDAGVITLAEVRARNTPIVARR